MSIYPYIAIPAGIFTLVCALMDWDWFMNDARAKFFVRLFGRQGARLFYVLLGLGLILAGALKLSNRL